MQRKCKRNATTHMEDTHTFHLYIFSCIYFQLYYKLFKMKLTEYCRFFIWDFNYFLFLLFSSSSSFFLFKERGKSFFFSCTSRILGHALKHDFNFQLIARHCVVWLTDVSFPTFLTRGYFNYCHKISVFINY